MQRCISIEPLLCQPEHEMSVCIIGFAWFSHIRKTQRTLTVQERQSLNGLFLEADLCIAWQHVFCKYR